MQNVKTDISTLLINFFNQEDKSWAIPMQVAMTI